MNIRSQLAGATVATLLVLAGVCDARAEIKLRLSVKFILNTNGAYPSGGIGTNAGFQVEVDRGSGILAATGRAYKLDVVEYLPIQPPPPAGQPPNFWFTNDARSNRRALEAASIADPVSWRRNNAGALNIYVNNSSSGSCSFVADGDSISLGKTIGTGTVLHEIGHFFNLSHTHAGDPSCTNPPPYTLGDGDGLSETVPDHNCISTRAALIAALPVALQGAVDTSWLNVMSYHQEDQLIDIQMDYWAFVANGDRLSICSGRTWFVANGGSDGGAGDSAGSPFATISRGLASVDSGDDVVLLRAGTYSAPPGGVINRRCTLSAARGTAFITP